MGPRDKREDDIYGVALLHTPSFTMTKTSVAKNRSETYPRLLAL